jgi:hypothetical protein
MNGLPLRTKRVLVDESSSIHSDERLYVSRDGRGPDDYCPEPLTEDAEQRSNSIARIDDHTYALDRSSDSRFPAADASADADRNTTAGDDTSTIEDAGTLMYGQKITNADGLRSVESDADDNAEANADARPDDRPVRIDAPLGTLAATLLY